MLFAGAPDTSYLGASFTKTDVAAEAVPNKDDHNESAPVIMAYVRVDPFRSHPGGTSVDLCRRPGKYGAR